MLQQHAGSARHIIRTQKMSFTIKASRTDGTLQMTEQLNQAQLRWIDRSDQFLKIVGSYPLEAD